MNLLKNHRRDHIKHAECLFEHQLNDVLRFRIRILLSWNNKIYDMVLCFHSYIEARRLCSRREVLRRFGFQRLGWLRALLWMALIFMVGLV